MGVGKRWFKLLKKSDIIQEFLKFMQPYPIACQKIQESFLFIFSSSYLSKFTCTKMAFKHEDSLNFSFPNVGDLKTSADQQLIFSSVKEVGLDRSGIEKNTAS